jgi:hypothetical protein
MRPEFPLSLDIQQLHALKQRRMIGVGPMRGNEQRARDQASRAVFPFVPTASALQPAW